MHTADRADVDGPNEAVSSLALATTRDAAAAREESAKVRTGQPVT